MQWLNSLVRGIAIAGVEILRILGEIPSGPQDFFHPVLIINSLSTLS